MPLPEEVQIDSDFFRMFDHLDLLFFVKDREGRLVHCNPAHRDSLYRMGAYDDLYGKKNHDFFPPRLADAFEEDDHRVLKGETIVGRIELNVIASGSLGWFSTNKSPLRHQSEIVGLIGISQRLHKADPGLGPFSRVAPAVDHIDENFTNEIETASLARLCSLSTRHFQREFQRLFKMSPQQLILRLRIQKACRHLRERSDSIAEIAFACGFDDQNYFARQFKRMMGVTPSGYRKGAKTTADRRDESPPSRFDSA